MDVERIEGIVAHVNALRPDCVLLLGDYVAGHKIAPLLRARRPQGLGGRAGRPAGAARRARGARQSRLVGGATQVQRRALRARPRPGWRCRTPASPCYENTACGSSRTAHPFWIAGLGDQWALLAVSPGRAAASTRASTISPARWRSVTDDAPVVLMAHEPDIFPLVPDRVALTVAGHTHGGQVRVLGYAPDRAFEVRRPLCLRPRRRAGPQPHRLGRPRLQRLAGALRLAAGNRVDRARRPRSSARDNALRLVLLAP